MSKPSDTTIQINERERNTNDDEREDPVQQSPVGVCFGEEPNRQKKRSADDNEKDRQCVRCRSERSRFDRPPFPKQIDDQKWNDQPIIVLGIKPPFAFQLIDELEPKKSESEDGEEPSGFVGTAF